MADIGLGPRRHEPGLAQFLQHRVLVVMRQAERAFEREVVRHDDADQPADRRRPGSRWPRRTAAARSPPAARRAFAARCRRRSAVPPGLSSRRNSTSKPSSSDSFRYCATECSTIRSNEPSGFAAASSGVSTEIFGLLPKRCVSDVRTFGAASTSDRCPARVRDEIGRGRFAAAIVHHAAAGGHVFADVLRDRAVMHVAVPVIDVNQRMLGVVEADPVAWRHAWLIAFARYRRHSFGSSPSLPVTGSLSGTGTFGIDPSALSRSAGLSPRQRLYVPSGG